jgi:hypothetical protein
VRGAISLGALALLLALPGVLPAQQAGAVRVQGEPPKVDGRLDEVAWRAAAPLIDLIQEDPDEGAPASEPSEIRFLYTDETLYVGFRGYDRAPEAIVGRLVRRDQSVQADRFSLFLDSYLDRRTAFEFTLNPSGARRDVFISEDGDERDDSWDPVYQWATTVDSLGWTAELAIPFSQLRFRESPALAFGLRVRRIIHRRNEEANWPFVPRDQAGEVSRYGLLTGLSGIPKPRRIELRPYAAASTERAPEEEGDPFRTGEDSDFHAGADFKAGLPAALTLDATINPDFGQVEADAAVVNLSEFEIFFPEKRPFFVEAGDLFRFDLAPDTDEGLVYTRRIGRTPQVEVDDDDAFVEEIDRTTIVGAAKLSGRPGGGWAVGLLEAVTGREEARFQTEDGEEGRIPVEPLTSYTVARAERTTREGRLTFGAMGGGVVRQNDHPSFDALHERAYSGAVDLDTRFADDTWQVSGALMGSRVEGSTEALVATQLSSARFYQRPDQDYVEVDSTRTSLSGYAGYGQFAKVEGSLVGNVRYETRSPGFEVNDLGFQQVADFHAQQLELRYRWLEPARNYRRFEVFGGQELAYTYGGERTALSVTGGSEVELPNYWEVVAVVRRELENLDPRLLRGGPAFQEPADWEAAFGLETDDRGWVQADVEVERSWEDETDADGWEVDAEVLFRPWSRLGFGVEVEYDRETDDRQFVASRTAADSTFYVFGRLEQDEVSLRLRADVALSPRLSFELYAEPFASSGSYRDLKLVADPRADDYADRFELLGTDRLSRPGGDERATVDVDRDGDTDFSFSEPDFRVVSLRTNAVLRWEFRPGSTFFLVWQQDREDEIPEGSLRLSDALGDIVDADGEHVFLVKVAYWLGW